MPRHSKARLIPLACTVASLALLACQREQATAPAPLSAERRSANAADSRIPHRLQHLVVMYLENHSFDNLYGEFAGADGLSNATGTATQVDAGGHAILHAAADVDPRAVREPLAARALERS